MRRIRPRTSACERSRESLSLRLDGELSEFESVLLHAHLARCETCSAFGADLAGFTGMLRSAPLVEPERQAQLPRHRHLPMRGLRVVAATAVAAAAAAIGIGNLGGSTAPVPVSAPDLGPAPAVPSNRDLVAARNVRRSQNESNVPLLWLPPHGLQQIVT